MSEPTPSSPDRDSSPERSLRTGRPATEDDLVERLSSPIDQAREAIASYANVTLKMTYWQVGAIIDAEVLNEERAEYEFRFL